MNSLQDEILVVVTPGHIQPHAQDRLGHQTAIGGSQFIGYPSITTTTLAIELTNLGHCAPFLC